MSRHLVSPLLLVALLIPLKAEKPIQDSYLPVYVTIHDGDIKEKDKDYLGALINFKVALACLQAMHEEDANWQPVLVNKRIKDCQNTIDRLQPVVEKQFLEVAKSPLYSKQEVFDLYDEGVRLESAHNWHAISQLEQFKTILEIMHRQDTKWDSAHVERRIKESQEKIDQLIKSILQAASSKSNGSKPVQ